MTKITNDLPQATDISQCDPKGLIREAYRIEGISLSECRSIFVDWALSLPDGMIAQDAIPPLLTVYGQEGHPMTQILSEGRTRLTGPRVRKGGWRTRPRG